MIKNIIFDFDGVIVDSEVLVSKAFAEYFIKIDNSLTEEDFYEYAGLKTIDVIDILSKKFNINNKKKFQSEIFEITSNIYYKNLELVQGVKKFVLNTNKKLFIGSNSNKKRIIEGLKIVGLSSIFYEQKVYSFDMVKKPKPSPDIYLKVLYDNNLNLEETLIIEDSGVGVKAGTLAGVKVFGLTAGKHWHSKRDTNELYINGAINVYDSYKNIERAIEGL